MFFCALQQLQFHFVAFPLKVEPSLLSVGIDQCYETTKSRNACTSWAHSCCVIVAAAAAVAAAAVLVVVVGGFKRARGS